jgi:hypothetical protein
MFSQTPSYNTRCTFSTSVASDLTPTVAAIGELELTGNLAPHSWYSEIKLPSGRTDLVGITLLGDIVYQHRPGVVRDEATGAPLRLFKRFARDKFCASIGYFCKKFSLTPDQVRQGLKRLEAGGYIRREYRDIMVAGRWVRGMTFIDPVPERIRAITPPPRPDARPVPGAVQRPKAAARQRRAVAVPQEASSAIEDAVSAPAGAVQIPGGAVQIPGGAVQIPPYRDTAKIPEETTTTPPTPSSSSETSSRCCWGRQPLSEKTQTPLPPATEVLNTPPAATEEKTGQPPATPVSAVPAPSHTAPTASRATEEDTPAPAAPLPAVPGVLASAKTPTTTAEGLTRPAEAPAAPSTAPAAPLGGAVLLTLLLFDFYLADLTPAQKADLCRRLARLPAPLAQAVLDEYNSAVGRKVQFRNKWGWFEFLIRAALDGRFIPTADLAERRAAQANAPPQAVEASALAPAPLTPPPSAVWEAHREELARLFPPVEVGINLSPLRAVEDGQALWLEAPNTFVVNWVRAHLSQIETVLRPHTALPLRVRIG